MAHDAGPKSEFKYDAFISYSRRDIVFARRFEETLNAWAPPRDLQVPQRRLRVFRDESDFTGPDYITSLENHLRTSAKLIVLCSPDSAGSKYVADEIRRFAEFRGAGNIIPVLVAGLPNNEAGPADDAKRAFADDLVRLLPIPLASDYRDFDAKSDKLTRGRFAAAWYKTLADLYADHGVDRAQVERRERKRETRRRRTIAGSGTVIGSALLALTVWALISRAEALARLYASEATLAFDGSGDGLVRATLLDVASLKSKRTAEGQIGLQTRLALLPHVPIWTRRIEARGDASQGGGRNRALAFSPDGAMIAAGAANGHIDLLDATNGATLRSVDSIFTPSSGTMLVFSPDGRTLIAGCGHLGACVIDPATGRILTHLPQGERSSGGGPWSAAFTPDGTLLATAGYQADDVTLYETATWRTITRIPQPGSSTVFSVAFSPDGEILATADHQSLRFWRTRAPDHPVFELNARDILWGLTFNPDGDLLVTAGRSLEIYQVESTDSGAISLVRSTEQNVTSMATGRGLATLPGENACFADGTSSALSIVCGRTLSEVLRVPAPAWAIAPRPDGRAIAVMSDSGIISLWPLDRGSDVRRIAVGGAATALAIAPDESWLAVAADSTVAVLQSGTWQQRRRLQPGGAVGAISITADGRRLLVATGAGLHAFDTRTWAETFSHEYAEDISAIAAAAANAIVIAGNQLSILDARDGRERMSADHDGSIQAVRISRDGRQLATVTERDFIRGLGLRRPTRTRVWDLQTGRESAWLYHEAEDNAASFYPPHDSSQLIRPLAFGDTTLVARSRDWPELVIRSPDEISSGDGRWTARSSFSDVTLKDVAQQLDIASLPHDGINAIAFLPRRKPRWLLSAGDDGEVRVWPLQPRDLTGEACARLQAILSPERHARLLAEMGNRKSCSAGR
jgi:WD40 repeat protein